jgi:hypothetical protein
MALVKTALNQRTRGLDIEKYKDEEGFERIARALGIPYPEKARIPATAKRR